MDEIFIRVIDFPCTDVKGTVSLDENGDYNVYLNARYTKEQQEKTLLHEFAHIECGHLWSDRDITEIEAEARERAQTRLGKVSAPRKVDALASFNILPQGD